MKRTYTIPLRRGFRNTQRNMRAKKAVTVTQDFLKKHFKADEVKLGAALNDALWSRGIKNPPARVTVDCEKTDEGVVYANLQGEQVLPLELEAQESKEEEKESEPKTESAPAKKEAKKEPKAESKQSVTLEEVKGLGPSRIEALKEAGISDAKALAEAELEELSNVEGVGEATAKKLQEAAKKAL